MTVIDRYQQRYPLPRAGMTDFWVLVQTHFAQTDREIWRDLALFALKETAGWSLEKIGLAFGLNPGHVSRRLHKVHQKLRERLLSEPLAQHVWDVLNDPDFLPTDATEPSLNPSRTESPDASRNAPRFGPETRPVQPPQTSPARDAGLRTPQAFAD